MGKTFNPFKTIGSYLGVVAGYLFTLKGINAFGFLLYYMNLSSKSLLGANLIGGFVVGYAAHLFLRALINTGKRRSKKLKKMNEYKPKGL